MGSSIISSSSPPTVGCRVRVRRECSDWPRVGLMIGEQFGEWTPVLWDGAARPEYTRTATIEREGIGVYQVA